MIECRRFHSLGHCRNAAGNGTYDSRRLVIDARYYPDLAKSFSTEYHILIAYVHTLVEVMTT